MEDIALTLKDAARISLFSRSMIYAMIGGGEIQAKKAGRRTMILAVSLRRAIAALPAARIAARHPGRAA
jgi:hypothetical protein